VNRILPKNIITEMDRKLMGCIQLSAESPLRFIFESDDTVSIYVGDELRANLSGDFFAALQPIELLDKAGVTINEQAGKY